LLYCAVKAATSTASESSGQYPEDRLSRRRRRWRKRLSHLRIVRQAPETANLLWRILLWSMHLWSTDFARDCLAIRQNAAALKTSI
jgi:hypothetical protein